MANHANLMKEITGGFQQLFKQFCDLSSTEIPEKSFGESQFSILHLIVLARIILKCDRRDDEDVLTEFTLLYQHATKLNDKVTHEILLSFIHQQKLVESRDRYGQTPLHYAVINGNVECTSMLVEKLKFPSLISVLKIQDNNGWTANHWAGAGNSYEALNCIIELFVKSSSNTDSFFMKDKCKRSPLHISVLQKNISLTRSLVRMMKLSSSSHIELISDCDEDGVSPFDYAIRSKSPELIIPFLDIMSAEELFDVLKHISKDCVSATIHTVFKGANFPLVALRDHQTVCDIVQCPKNNSNVNNLEAEPHVILELLFANLKINHHAETLLKLKDHAERTVMHLAVDVNAREFVQYIIDVLKPRPIQQYLAMEDKHGMTALHYCARNGSVTLFRTLIYAVSVQDRLRILAMKDKENCWSVVHQAIESGAVEVIRILLHCVHPEEMIALLRITTQEDDHCTYSLSDVTPLGLAAIHSNVEVFSLILDSLKSALTSTSPTILSILNISDSKGYTVMHHAAMSRSVKIIVAIIDLLGKRDAHSLITNVIDDAPTCVQCLWLKPKRENTQHDADEEPTEREDESEEDSHEGLDQQRLPCLKAILTPLERPQRFKLLMNNVNDPTNCTILHTATKHNDLQCVKEILNSLEDVDRYSLIATPGINSSTVLHMAAKNIVLELFKVILYTVVEKDRLGIVVVQDDKGATVLHHAVNANSEALLQIIVDALDKKERLSLCLLKTQAGQTALHQIVEHQVFTLLKPMFESLRKEQRYQLVRVKDNKGCHVVHHLLHPLSAHSNQVIALEYILRELSAMEVGNLITCLRRAEEDIFDRMDTILTHFLDKIMCQLHLHTDNKEIFEWLDENILILNLISSYITLDDKMIRFLSAIPEEVRSKLLTRDRIEFYSKRRYTKQIGPSKLLKSFLEWASSQTECYFLSTPPVILVMFSTEAREGADDEIAALNDVFPDFVVKSIVRKDLTEKEMMDSIRMAQTDEDLSALIVIIMSHGEQGRICAKDKTVRIQDILRQMAAPILTGKPKVLVIQACQSKRTNGGDRLGIAESSELDPTPPISQFQQQNSKNIFDNKEDSGHLEFRDFVMYIAAVDGGLAARNLMIPIFAKLLKDSAPDSDILEVFQKTNKEIQQRKPNQIPKLEHTTTQKILLKKVFGATEPDPTPQKLRQPDACLIM